MASGPSKQEVGEPLLTALWEIPKCFASTLTIEENHHLPSSPDEGFMALLGSKPFQKTVFSAQTRGLSSQGHMPEHRPIYFVVWRTPLRPSTK